MITFIITKLHGYIDYVNHMFWKKYYSDKIDQSIIFPILIYQSLNHHPALNHSYYVNDFCQELMN